MKRILFLISLVALVWSCSSDSEGEPSGGSNNPPSNETKEYIVSLGMIGEILDIGESPLTKANNNDLYGIQVSSKTATKEYVPYAYGLFDDKSLMTIKLLEGYTYKFQATMIIDGKNRVHFNGGYSFPFFADGNTKIGNVFIFSNKGMTGLMYGGTTLPENYWTLYKIPNTERFYGAIEDYSPVENGNISINMKRVCFGAKFIAEGLTEGKLKINIKDAPELNIAYGKTVIQDIFTFDNTYPYGLTWTQDNYSETIPVSISWEKVDSAIVPLIKKDITFKRNVLTTITIKVKDTSINNGIDISQETGEMVKGDDITLESGTGLDNNIDPSK